MATCNIVSLWRAFRGLENSYRYYSDVILGIIAQHPEGENLNFEVRKFPAPGWMDLCLPPMCHRLMVDIADELDFMAEKAKALKAMVDDLNMKLMADNPPMPEVNFLATELPGTRLMVPEPAWDPDGFIDGETP